MQETWIQSLAWEDPLEKGMATHSQYSCLENSMDRGAWAGYSPWGHKRVGHDLATKHVSKPLEPSQQLWA